MPKPPPSARPKTTGRSPVAAKRVDISGNQRIPVLMHMVGALSQARGPREVVKVFSNREELYGPRGYVSVSTQTIVAIRAEPD
jgi:hypothetical protein